jgi:HD-GYP domain-containing protein (c-di-GMP phosphodiesterase class II)/pSer/pThr/pTyr-binding forkhead associated (FHA) protein
VDWRGFRSRSVKRRIRLRGINGNVDGKTWDSENLLRAGRLATLEIVLEDTSVSRRHAELRYTEKGWRVRDLGSTNGTYVNGTRLGPGEWPVRPHDIVRFGNVSVVVDNIQEAEKGMEDTVCPIENMQVAAVGSQSWEEAFSFAFDREESLRPNQQLQALLRAGHHLVHLDSEEELLHTILRDAVITLKAQRGAIALAEGPDGPLRLRALDTGNNMIASRTAFSQSLAQRCFSNGQSILCCSVDEDPELLGAKSIAEGTMASVLCVLLRTPRKRLGVLHLDRGPIDDPFNKEDMHLADALAAHVSAGIESAQLLKKQRELFYATIMVLADLVEMRDPYTGGHTRRVTEYSTLLAQHLEVSAKELHLIKMGTPLHDIGKIGIDDAILRKPGKLTPAEFEVMKTHAIKGAKILETVPDLVDIIPIVRSHHERWDGGGYPDGTAGEKTDRLARIVAVADAFDAMTSDRPYRKGMNAEVAFAEVAKMKGKQFDPVAAQAFLDIKERIIQEMQSETKKINMQQLGVLRLAVM